MTIKEKVRNNIMIKMQYHLDSVTMDILNNVILHEFAGIEIVEMETLPATVDDTNKYIIDLFMLKKAPKLSQKTVTYYLETINAFIAKVNKPLTKVTSMDIEMFLNSIRATNKEVSLNNNRRNISAFFTWMRKSHLILENPCDAIEPYKEALKPIDHLEPEEFEQLKSGCKHKRDRAMIEFLRCTAMRVGEVAQTRICDIDWNACEVLVYGEKTRTYRSVWLDSVAITYLQDYLSDRGVARNSEEPIFTHVVGDKSVGLSKDGIRLSLASIKKRADMQRRVYPHLLRKTTATNIVKRGGTISDAGEYIGHKQKSTAGKHYAFIGKEHTQDIFRRYVAAV